MNGSPAVIVNKSGFFASLAKGVFGTIMVALVCATATGLFVVHTVDKNVSEVTGGLFGTLSTWRESMPPAVADALSDRRAPEYRQFVKVSARLAEGRDERGGGELVIVEVENTGPETVTLLALRLTLENEAGVPIRDFIAYGATPFAIDDEWRGPLLPGSGQTRFSELTWSDRAAKVSVEVRDLRVAAPMDRPAPEAASRSMELPAPPHVAAPVPTDVERPERPTPPAPPARP